MKIQSLPLCIGLFALACASTALAQDHAKRAELSRAATGESFAIDGKTFRLVPSAAIREAGATTGLDEVVVANYVIGPAAASSARVKRDLGAAADAAARPNLGAAVAADGTAVVILPQLSVYVSDISVVDAIVRDTGGVLTYSSAVGGKATIRYPSIAEAMSARQRILGRAGVKEVNPDRV
ncbi:hypothetical protein, partial [Pseudomonas sp. CGJS7]|uniref:hypothetical protein n=1 Tax=Pseudomonas sp. CGJS7 TaxID=3109348 RepID=UPI00300A34DA